MRSLNVVSEGEEGVRAQSDPIVFGQPCPLFFCRKDRRSARKYLLPGAIRKEVLILIADIEIDGIVPIRSLDAIEEGKPHDPGILPQPPVVRLLARQSGAVNSGLLACPDTDRLPILDIADGIGLGVL